MASRKSIGKSFAKLIRDETKDGAELVELALSIMRGKKTGRNAASINTDWNQRMDAAKWLADRAFGKSVAQLDIEVQPSDAPEELKEFTIEQLEGMRDAIVVAGAEEVSSPPPS